MMRGSGPYWLDPADPDQRFPDPRLAVRRPNGLLAVGGDLTPTRLLNAYRHGIFPWFSEGQPLLWWSPDPRTVLFPEDLKVSRSLKKRLRSGSYTVTFDHAFRRVMEGCAAPRVDAAGTWITDTMIDAYCRLHELGYAHSVESWHEGELVGGLYGVALGKMYYGESMFSRRTDASKVAFVHLVRQLVEWGFGLIDCQVGSPHLYTLGAVDIPRSDFLRALEALCEQPSVPGPWQLQPEIVERLVGGWGEREDDANAV